MKLPETDKSDLTRGKRIFGLHPNVFFLGLVSLLTDASSEMIFTLVPLFLSNVLGTTVIVIGLIGGLSESADAVFRILSGWFSDRIGRRKPLTVLGYSFSTVAKFFMYLAAGWGSVLAIRFGDRVGKGIRTSARDALVADSVAAGERGKGFGLHRAMDTLGAVTGLAVAALIIYLLQGGGLRLSLDTYRWLVLVGVVPAVLGVLALIVFVREERSKAIPHGSHSGVSLPGQSGGFDTRFKLFLVIMALFTLGNSSDFFLILRAQDIGSSVVHIVLMLVVHNIAYAVTALPAGIVSDRLGRRWVISAGWLIYALVYLGLALATESWQVWLLFAGYGLYYGLVEGVARAFVADLVPAEKRGTAYGLYHGVVGLTLLPASLMAGWLWQTISPAAPFYLGAVLAFLALLGMMALMRE